MIVSTQIIERRASSASGAEVGARELIETHAPRLSVQGDPSLEQAIDSIGRAGGALDVLLDQDDRGALGPDAPERLVDLIDDRAARARARSRRRAGASDSTSGHG